MELPEEFEVVLHRLLQLKPERSAFPAGVKHCFTVVHGGDLQVLPVFRREAVFDQQSYRKR